MRGNQRHKKLLLKNKILEQELHQHCIYTKRQAVDISGLSKYINSIDHIYIEEIQQETRVKRSKKKVHSSQKIFLQEQEKH